MKLPHDIIQHIYQFIFPKNIFQSFKNKNIEIKDIFSITKTIKLKNNLSNEFFAKTTFWRIKWLNREFNIGASSDDEDENSNSIYEIKFDNSKSSIESVVNYWNYDYPDYYNLLPLENKLNCVQEFITDNFKKSKRVLKNLQLLKKYNWDNETHNLYKPANKSCTVKKIVCGWRGKNSLIMEVAP